MSDNFYAVIMAGGGGTRLWPLSRKAKPKQMLQLIDERSLFQIAVQRLEDLFPPDRILVVTVADQAAALQQQAVDIPKENYLLEPMPRGTASVVGLAAIALQHRDPNAVMAVLTSDHFIGNEKKFLQLLQAAEQVALDGYLVTLGIEPTSPSSAYGYIQQGDLIGTYQALIVYQALRFKEKPDVELAASLIATGDHAWNSGMFVWQVNQVMEEFSRQMPDLSGQLERISQAWGTPDREKVLHQVWPQINPETIDFGIMEGARAVAVIPAAGLNWNDVGSWDSLFEVLSPDQTGNIIIGGQHIGLETSNSLIYQNNGDRLVVTIGIEDLVVVDTDDVLLVCQKDDAQKVRQIVSQLRASGDKFI
ncbi:MAG: mannose-1-phosphate guanylyltransferase [Chloroflexota bacterium]|nr:MAG: mannose-1-phosphate guanylyltransferase [Chloroflexota bacterium]